MSEKTVEEALKDVRRRVEHCWTHNSAVPAAACDALNDMEEAIRALAREKADKAPALPGTAAFNAAVEPYERLPDLPLEDVRDLQQQVRDLDHRLYICQSAATNIEKDRDAALNFKAYVHQRLDEAGVATRPEGPHSAQGCRVGDRLDLLVNERDAAKAALAEAQGTANQHKRTIEDLRSEMEFLRRRTDATKVCSVHVIGFKDCDGGDKCVMVPMRKHIEDMNRALADMAERNAVLSREVTDARGIRSALAQMTAERDKALEGMDIAQRLAATRLSVNAAQRDENFRVVGERDALRAELDATKIECAALVEERTSDFWISRSAHERVKAELASVRTERDFIRTELEGALRGEKAQHESVVLLRNQLKDATQNAHVLRVNWDAADKDAMRWAGVAETHRREVERYRAAATELHNEFDKLDPEGFYVWSKAARNIVGAILDRAEGKS